MHMIAVRNTCRVSLYDGGMNRLFFCAQCKGDVAADSSSLRCLRIDGVCQLLAIGAAVARMTLHCREPGGVPEYWAQDNVDVVDAVTVVRAAQKKKTRTRQGPREGPSTQITAPSRSSPTSSRRAPLTFTRPQPLPPLFIFFFQLRRGHPYFGRRGHPPVFAGQSHDRVPIVHHDVALGVANYLGTSTTSFHSQHPSSCQ